MADQTVIPVNTKPGQSVFPPTAPQQQVGPPLPPEVQQALATPANPGMPSSSPSPLPDIINSLVNGGGSGSPTDGSRMDATGTLPPPPTNVPGLDAPPTPQIGQPLPPELSDVAGGLASEGYGKPQRKVGLLEKIGKFLPLIGAAGGFMEAAGNPMHDPVGAELFQKTLQENRNRELEAYKVQNVDVPTAQALAEYRRYINPTKQSVADTNADARIATAGIANHYKVVQGVGLFDTQTKQLIPGSQQGVMITPDIASNYQLPQEFVGRVMKISDLAAQERALSANLTTVQGAKGPALVNKGQGTGKDLGLGSPAATARQSGVVDAIDSNNNVVPMTDAQRLANGFPRAGTQLAVGKETNKVWEPALDADTRLTQMMEQATDKTGASDMALLFNHMAMTGGNVRGLRMGSYITEEHMKARGIPEELGVLYNHVLSGQVLSPQQRVNFVRLAQNVRQTRWAQAAKEAGVLGVSGNQPSPDPDLPSLPTTNSAPISMNPAPTPRPRSTGNGGGNQPTGMINVQIPGHPPGQIPANQRNAFLKDNPGAKVLN